MPEGFDPSSFSQSIALFAAGGYFVTQIVLKVIKAIQPKVERPEQSPEIVADAVVKKMNGTLRNLDKIHQNPCPELIKAVAGQEQMEEHQISMDSKLTKIITMHHDNTREALFEKFANKIIEKMEK